MARKGRTTGDLSITDRCGSRDGTTRRWDRSALFTLLATLLVPTWTPSAKGHDFTITETDVRFAADGLYSVDVKCDLDALALGAESKQDSASLVRRLRALAGLG